MQQALTFLKFVGKVVLAMAVFNVICGFLGAGGDRIKAMVVDPLGSLGIGTGS